MKNFILFLFISILITYLLNLSITQRMFFEEFYDLELGAECGRLASCMENVSYSVDWADNKCIIFAKDYWRKFWIPELRGSLRTCEIMRGEQNKRLYGL